VVKSVCHQSDNLTFFVFSDNRYTTTRAIFWILRSSRGMTEANVDAVLRVKKRVVWKLSLQNAFSVEAIYFCNTEFCLDCFTTFAMTAAFVGWVALAKPKVSLLSCWILFHLAQSTSLCLCGVSFIHFFLPIKIFSFL
jgi:hypothetical protein